MNFDLSDIRFIKRIVIGSAQEEYQQSESEKQDAIALVNRCLSGSPKGILIGVEKGSHVSEAGKEENISHYIVYHIGFPRKPAYFD